MTHLARADKGATWPLLQTVFESILEVFILCLAGWFLARRNILDKRTQKKLNVVNINLFTPALLFSKVAFFLSPSKLKELWIIPFIFVIVTLTSTFTGWALARACRLKKSQRAFAIAASMFMNSNSLPIALMQSLVVTVHGLKWTKDDTRDGMLGRALTYLVLHSTFGMMLRWSYGVKLLSQADDEVTPDPNPTEESSEEREEPRVRANEYSRLLDSTHREYSTTTLRSNPSIYTDEPADSTTDQTHLPFSESRNTASSTSGLVAPTRFVPKHVSAPKVLTLNDSNGTPQVIDLPPQLGSKPMRPPVVNRRSHFFYSFPNTPQLSRTSLVASRDQIASSPTPPSPPTPPPPAEPTFSSKIKGFFIELPSRTWIKLRRIGRSIREFMTPPLYSALLSLLIACIPPLQHLLDVHMPPVKGAIASAGNCSIPITLVVLGGYFWRESPPDGEDNGMRTNLPQHIARERERTRSQPRPVSEATLVGTGTWRHTWNSLKHRSKGYLKIRDHDYPDPSTEPSNSNGEVTTPGLEEAPASIPPPVPAKSSSSSHKGEARTVLVAILSRMIITPALLLPIMALVMSKTTMRLFDDPVFVLSNVLFISSPPALTLAQITQAASGDAFERLISKTIFWSYLVVTPITTLIYVFVGLELSKL